MTVLSSFRLSVLVETEESFSLDKVFRFNKRYFCSQFPKIFTFERSLFGEILGSHRVLSSCIQSEPPGFQKGHNGSGYKRILEIISPLYCVFGILIIVVQHPYFPMGEHREVVVIKPSFGICVHRNTLETIALFSDVL